jgi:lambda family phage portal protein
MLVTRDGHLRLQLLNPEQVDSSVNVELEGQRRVIAGVEIDRVGQRVAYHIRGDPDLWGRTGADPPVRVSADDVCHVFEAKSPGQIRGISWLTPVATKLLELDSAEDAALAKLKTTALLTGFVRDLEGISPNDDFNWGDLNLEPGTLRRLNVGQDITFSPISDFSGVNDFIKHMARTISAGSGIPYSVLTSDLESVNYSSGKMGMEAFKRRCVSIRASLLGTLLLDKIWKRFVTLEILSGRLNSSFEDQALFQVSWLWPSWSPLEPYRESRADEILLRNGLASREQLVSARGRDLRDVDAEISSDPLQVALMAAANAPRAGRDPAALEEFSP